MGAITDIFNGKSQEDLDEIVALHPYFSLAHLHRLKLTVTNDSNYDTLTSRAALHFNNPFLLNVLLNEDENDVKAGLIQQAPGVETAEIPDVETTVTPEVETTINPEVETTVIPEPVSVKIDLPEADTKSELVFEPLYTTDYFLSQGIRLNLEQPTDKLGKQLKSFTQWLKTMKNIHDSKNPVDHHIDPAVQDLAEKSNREEDVVTEAMAEVFEQQGKYAKARDIYAKLSLLNPAKSAYFAARIENLNKE